MNKIIDIETGLNLQEVQAALEVSEGEDFAKRIIDSTNDGILAYDRQCRYTLWNPAVAALTGKSRAEVVGRLAFDVFPFLVEQGAVRVFEETLAGQVPKVLEIPYHFPASGRDGILQTRHSPLRDEKGAVVGGLAIVRDVTEVRRAVERVQELNLVLEHTFQFMSEVSSLLSASRQPQEAIRNAVNLATRHFDGLCCLRSVRTEGGFDSVIASQDPTKLSVFEKLTREYLPGPDAPAGPVHVLNTGRADWVQDLPNHLQEWNLSPDNRALIDQLGSKSYICVPISNRRGAPLGTLSLFSPNRHFCEADLRAAECLGHLLGLCMELAQKA